MKSAITALVFILIGSAGVAQERWPISIEVGGGHGAGHTTGEYLGNRSGLAFDAVIAYRLTSGKAGGMVVALNTGAQGSGAVTSVCIPATGGGCVPAFPSFLSTAGLAGYETSSNWTVRGLFGPAWVRADDSTYGFQGRVDMAVPLISRLSFIVSARGLIVPSYRGDRFRLYAFSGGLRIR